MDSVSICIRKFYLIFFLARSGSTWLKDICEKTDRLGRPSEIFNLANKRFARWPLERAIPKLIERNQRNGVFGAELTWGHIRDTFGGPAALFHFFPNAPTAFLIREDIVLQAISGLRRMHTNVGHNRDGTGGDDPEFPYDPEFIKRGVRHRMRTEKRFEAMFREYGVRPLRMSYERNVGNPLGAVNAIADLIGEPRVEEVARSRYAVLRSGRSEAYAERFRSEEPRFMKRIDEARRPMLDKLDDY